jgi:hypothetical protein
MDVMLPFISVIVIFCLLLVFIMVYRYRGRYRVEEVYLVYYDGTLIRRESILTGKGRDGDIISGMFTAVQSFVKDAFMEMDKDGTSGDATLKNLEFGEKRINIERTERFYIAVVFTGRPGTRLYRCVRGAKRLIEDRYGNILRTWNGDMQKLKGIGDITRSLLELEVEKGEPGMGRTPPAKRGGGPRTVSLIMDSGDAPRKR